MFHIDEPLKDFLESGLAIIVGTASDDGYPHVMYGWGLRVHDDGQTLDVFVDTPRAANAMSDLAENGRIAVTVGEPVSYRSLQFKGTFSGSGEASGDDRAWVTEKREAFLVRASLIGDPPRAIRNLWLDDFHRISFRVERAFDQTPGPEAGRPL